LKIDASFVRSAASASDLPHDGLAELALVGRSNVGKSSLINSLVRQRIARTSAAPGKTRLANIYRVVRGNAGPFYLVDLPGYGYARGGRESAAEFSELTNAYFAPVRLTADTHSDRAALLLVDSRHPGLRSDLDAWTWLRDTVDDAAIVATKIDKLARGQRIRAMRELESVFEHPVLPVSAVTGEGLDQLWTLIDNLTRQRKPPPPSSRSRRNPNPLPGGTAAPGLRARRPKEAARRPKK
jgi:GTP-binding protein